MTSKLQVTVPKALADQYGIRPGDEITWLAAGDAIRVVPAARPQSSQGDPATRLKVFDQATARQRHRTRGRPKTKTSRDRGWTREDLYQRDRAR